jgi:hypothetical protein
MLNVGNPADNVSVMIELLKILNTKAEYCQMALYGLEKK